MPRWRCKLWPAPIRPRQPWPSEPASSCGRLRLVLRGCAGEGSLQWPDVVCAVPSRKASGHATLLCAPVTEAGRLPSRRVSQAIQAVLGAPRPSCRASRDCGAAFSAAGPRGYRGPGKSPRPATGNLHSVPSLTPRHLQSGSRVHSSPLPVSLPSATIQSPDTGPYYEAHSGSLVLQPAALH